MLPITLLVEFLGIKPEDRGALVSLLIIIVLVVMIAYLMLIEDGPVDARRKFKDSQTGSSNNGSNYKYAALIGGSGSGKTLLMRALAGVDKDFTTTLPSRKPQAMDLDGCAIVEYPGHPSMAEHVHFTVNDKHCPVIVVTAVAKPGHESIQRAARYLYDIATRPDNSLSNSDILILGTKCDMTGSMSDATEIVQAIDTAMKNLKDTMEEDGGVARRRHNFTGGFCLTNLKCRKLLSALCSGKKPSEGNGIESVKKMITNSF